MKVNPVEHAALIKINKLLGFARSQVSISALMKLGTKKISDILNVVQSVYYKLHTVNYSKIYFFEKQN